MANPLEDQSVTVAANGRVIGEVVFNSQTGYGGKALLGVEVDDSWGDPISELRMVDFALDRLWRHEEDYGPIRGIHRIVRIPGDKALHRRP